MTGITVASALDLFEQPGEKRVFQQPPERASSVSAIVRSPEAGVGLRFSENA
jgi:hypothetical protein